MVTSFATNHLARAWIMRSRMKVACAIVCVASLSVGLRMYSLGPVLCDKKFRVVVQLKGEDHSVEVEEFVPRGDRGGVYPAILFLHGVEGPERYRVSHSRSCRWLANQGYAVFYVHYFNAVPYQDLWCLRDDGSLDKEKIDRQCWADAERWSATVLQTLKHISHRPDVDQRCLALDGLSLGGFIALEVADEAARDSTIPDVCAVIVNWGAQFELTDCQPGFPPTLHIHGERDEVVPLNDARDSVAEIRAVGSEAELLVVPQAPHVARSRESDNHTLRFLARYLRPDARVASGEQLSYRAGDL